jgi:ABC-2 type transport system permease protein
MFERIRHMLVKEFLQVIRDPRMRTVIFVLPCIQTLIIGYAVSTDVQHVATAVYDMDNTEESRSLVARFTGSGYFDAVAYVENDARAQEAIDRGRASVILRINRGYSEDLRAGRTARVQLIVDGSDSNTAWIVLGYAGRIANGTSEQLLVERFTRQLGMTRDAGLVELKSRAWFNENLESRNFFVPGVIVIVVSIATLLLTSMAVVREKEVGTMEQIIVTPITPVEFILGKTVPFALIAFVDVALVSLVGVYWFGVPVRGSLTLLFFTTGLYLLTTLGVGLFISTVSRTQQQAMMSTFFFFFPAMLLSGFVFPIANMPLVVQWLDVLNPLAYFLVIVRGIFLKGVGMSVLWPQIAALAVIGVLTLSLAARRFHKTLS